MFDDDDDFDDDYIGPAFTYCSREELIHMDADCVYYDVAFRRHPSDCCWMVPGTYVDR